MYIYAASNYNGSIYICRVLLYTDKNNLGVKILIMIIFMMIIMSTCKGANSSKLELDRTCNCVANHLNFLFQVLSPSRNLAILCMNHHHVHNTYSICSAALEVSHKCYPEIVWTHCCCCSFVIIGSCLGSMDQLQGKNIAMRRRKIESILRLASISDVQWPTLARKSENDQWTTEIQHAIVICFSLINFIPNIMLTGILYGVSHYTTSCF